MYNSGLIIIQYKENQKSSLFYYIYWDNKIILQNGEADLMD